MLAVLDLADGDRDPAAFRNRLREAGHDCGFFYLVGHGVAAAQMAEVLALARAFFALPVHTKNEISQLNSPQFRGYSRLGGELTNGDVDWREQIDIGPERDAEGYWRLQGPNLWPSSPAGFRAAFEDWNAALLTLLLVEPGSTGLQVQSSARRWVDVAPLAGAFIVNIRELLEVATGGYLRATRYRVVAPPPGADRISIAFFLNPALDGENAWKSRTRSHPDVAERHHRIAAHGRAASY